MSAGLFKRRGHSIVTAEGKTAATVEDESAAFTLIHRANSAVALAAALARLRDAERAPRDEWVAALANADEVLTAAGVTP
jgi:hypothetical protein